MGHEVFISYSSVDKPTADAACATLESRGIRCWIAPRDILPGLDWGEAIIDAITESRLMVLVFSSTANQSPQIKREVERAVSKGIPIIPFRIEAVPLSKSLEYFISSPHWLDAMSPPMEKHLHFLCETVQLLLSRKIRDQIPPAPGTAQQQAQATAVPRPKASTGVDYRIVLAALAIFFIIGFLGLAVALGLWGKSMSQWVKHHIFGQPEQTTQIDKPVISKFQIRTEHNIRQQNVNGLLIHTSFQITKAKGHDCAAMVSFFDSNKQRILARNNSYASTNGTLASWRRFSPAYDPAVYDDWQLFMPYSEFPQVRGRRDYWLCVELFDGQTPLSDCLWLDFYITNP